MKHSLAKKTIRRLVILGILILISVNVVAVLRFYSELLSVYSESAYSYVKMIMTDVSGEMIEDMIAAGDRLQDLVIDEAVTMTESGVEYADPSITKKERELAGQWMETYTFLFQTISYNSNFVGFEVVVPEEEEVLCVFRENRKADQIIPMERRAYREKEQELLASRSVDINELFETDAVTEKLTIMRDKNGDIVGTAVVPVFNTAGDAVAFAELDVSIKDIQTAVIKLMSEIAGIIVLIMVVLLVIFYRIQKKQEIEPIVTLDRAASGAVDKLKEGGKPFRTDIHTQDEIESLANSFENMGESLESYIVENASFAAKQERLNTELALAATIQSDMLPRSFPAFPDRHDFDIYASMVPAKEVGGDFYDFFLVDENTLVLVIADVSGKGVPASLFMMKSMIMIENLSYGNPSPAAILDKVNKQLCTNNESGMFVTIWLGILDLKTGLLKAANAGHEYPILREPGGAFEVVKDKHSFVVGGSELMKFKEYELTLAPGSTLFLYSDGLPEAKNAENTMFRLDNTVLALNRDPDASPEELLHTMDLCVKDFVKEAEQFDDLTMLCIKYTGASGTEKVLDAKVENFPEVKEFLRNHLLAADCPAKKIKQILMSAEELFTNISMYAYEGQEEAGKVTVRFSMEDDPKRAAITFLDSGIPYDPMAKEDPDITLKADERKVGGLGIFMAKKFMDEIVYEYTDRQNILTIRKRLDEKS